MFEEYAGRWGDFSGLNAAYLLDLYDRYRAEPDAVDPATREFFERWGAPPSAAPAPREGRPAATADRATPQQLAGAAALAAAIRAHGHRGAHLDPLGSPPAGDAALLPETH